MALSCMSLLSRCDLPAGRLAGGDRRLSTIAARAAALLDEVLRREPGPPMGNGATPSTEMSRKAAATAATLAAVLVMDFRRVTLWLALFRALPSMEWEEVRECVCRDMRPEADAEAVEREERCWVNGLAV